tara:strand:- start:5457 stop:6050 length:594 start_codon:yes stop_codon:yes gene_type:complete
MTLYNKIIKSEIEDSINTKKILLNSDKLVDQLNNLINLCLKTFKDGGKIIFAGNGGSFGDSQHLSAEFISRFRFDRDPLPSIALGTNSSTITAIGNDYDYSQIFAREIKVVGNQQDLFIPISTSGNSKNIINAIKEAKTLGINTFGLSGNLGGQMIKECNCLLVPSDNTARIQECHITIGHILCGAIEDSIFQALKP